jgi:hypothetical protein
MKFIFLIALAMLTGCSTTRSLNLDLHVPTTKMISPETTGKALGVRAQAGIGATHKLSLARSSQTSTLFSSSPNSVVVDTVPKHSASMTLLGIIDVGVWKRIDISISKTGEGPYNFGGKFLVYGDPSSEVEGVKVSFAGHYGFQTDDEVASSEGLFDSKEEDTAKFTNVTGIIHIKSRGASIIVGKRISPKFMPYFHLYHETYEVESSLHVAGGQSYNLDTNLEHSGLLAGGVVGITEKDFTVIQQIEGGLSKLRISTKPDDDKDLKWSLGYSIGIKF